MFLLETIRIEDGRPDNIDLHTERMLKSQKEIFGKAHARDLASIIHVPPYAMKGTYKCRLVYDEHIRSIEFTPYQRKEIKSLRMIECDDIDYSYKYEDRQKLEELLAQKGDQDEILIVKDGRLTDTSYSNIVLKDKKGKWFTPRKPLLRGTRRQRLLNDGLIREREITPATLRQFTEIRLINSLNGIQETEGIPLENVLF